MTILQQSTELPLLLQTLHYDLYNIQCRTSKLEHFMQALTLKTFQRSVEVCHSVHRGYPSAHIRLSQF